MEPTNELVMPILVEIDEDATHERVVHDVATATFCAVRAMDLAEDPALKPWLTSGMRKTVRKTKAGSLRDRPSFGRACVGALKDYASFDRVEKRAQVSGWDLNRMLDEPGLPSTVLHREHHGLVIDPRGSIVIHVDQALSTGKAAAAAAHVTTLLALCTDPALTPLIGHALTSRLVLSFDRDVIAAIQDQPHSHVIHDAGHTEVQSGHVTAALTTW